MTLGQPIVLRLAPTPVVPVDCTAYVVGLSDLQVSHPHLDEDRLSLAFDERTIDACGSPVEILRTIDPQRGPSPAPGGSPSSSHVAV